MTPAGVYDPWCSTCKSRECDCVTSDTPTDSVSVNEPTAKRQLGYYGPPVMGEFSWDEAREELVRQKEMRERGEKFDDPLCPHCNDPLIEEEIGGSIDE